MGIFTTTQRIERVTTSIVVKRADGTIEDLGVVADSYFGSNPLKVFLFKIKNWFRR